jgi:hypothetical protein
MAGELIALGVSVHDEIDELVVAEHRHALGLVVAEIGFRHPGRPPAGRAVEEDLDRPDHEHVVARAADEPGGMALRHDRSVGVAEQRQPGPDRQPPLALRPVIRRDLWVAGDVSDGRIHAGGYP